MQYFRPLLIILIIILVPFYMFAYASDQMLKAFDAIILILGLLFLFNIVFRKQKWAKAYLTSGLNIFSAKYSSKVIYTIPRILMFQKLLEELENSDFTIQFSDHNKFEIFATSPLSWKSFGENIYLELREEGGETIVDFCSTTVFGMYAWGKNRTNFEHLVSQIEASLTI